MMSQSLASWQAANNYRKEGDVVYGVYQGCGFTVSEEDGGKLFIFMLSANDEGAFDSFEDALAAAGGAMAEGQVGDVESYLAVFYDESYGETAQSTMDDILDFTASKAKQVGFRVPNVCVKCGARATKRSFVDNMVQPLCADCSEQNKQKRRAAAKAAVAQPIVSEEDDYARQYAPIVADSSKYDDNYDEYAGMTTRHSDYTSDFSSYSDPYGGTVQGYDSNDDSEDDYRAIMGYDDEQAPAPDVVLGGSMGKGILGVLVGSLVGVVIYLIFALAFKFPMGALCCPAGMLAVVLYTKFGGVKVKSTGMALSIAFSTIISLVVVFFISILSYTSATTDFSGAMSYLFSDNRQTLLLVINLVLAVLGSIFGACLLIDVMDKYVGGDNTNEDSSSSDDSFPEFN